MRPFRRHSKVLGALLVLGFILSTVELHADHGDSCAQQEHHCGIQCCAAHNIAPQKKSSIAIVIDDNQFSFIADISQHIIRKIIPNTIFRPPISLV